MNIIHIVGARPNFMKAAPVMSDLARRDGIQQTLIHTGQHYDADMSGVFFRDLEMPEPDVNLGVGSGSHAQQTAEVMTRLEPHLLERRPDLVLVYGDVNSTVAAALVCAKLLIPVGHVEAGLRSYDRQMPEEINRLLTDQIADLLFTPSSDANENLLREGVKAERIHFVGNVMIDTLVKLLPKAVNRWENKKLSTFLPDNLEHYGLVTLHRPSNVDDPAMLSSIMDALLKVSLDLPLLFPIHPRTRERLKSSKPEVLNSKLYLLAPLSYLDFLALQSNATLVITDSGGIQEEATYLGIPCLTVRENTERPITVTMGTNIIVGQDMERLRFEVSRILSGDRKEKREVTMWDGHTAERIGKVIASWGRQ